MRDITYPLVLLFIILLLSGTVEGAQENAKVIKPGIEYLLKYQRPDGSWRGFLNSPDHPQVELAITALCGMALMAHPDVESDRSKKAINQALSYIKNFKHGNKWTVWGESYSIHFLTTYLEKHKKDKSLKNIIKGYVAVIERNQMRASGGWGYAGAPGRPQDTAKTFNTALCLSALLAARKAKVTINTPQFDRGIQALEKFRNKDGLFRYHFWSEDKKNTVQAGFTYEPAEALARSVMAEMVLFQAKKSSKKNVEAIVKKFFTHRSNLERAYKGRLEKVAHLPPNGTASYYYFFGHYYASLALQSCSKKLQKKYSKILTKTMAKTQESAGAWIDHTIVTGPNCSTAFALLILEK